MIHLIDKVTITYFFLITKAFGKKIFKYLLNKIFQFRNSQLMTVIVVPSLWVK